MMNNHIIIGTALLLISTNANADAIIFEKRNIIASETISAQFYRNEGGPVTFQLTVVIKKHTYTCKEEWDWEKIEKTTRIIRDNINEDKEINVIESLLQGGYTCKKK